MTEIVLVKLVEKRLQAWADRQDMQIAFEGVAFKPPPSAIYARVKHLPASTTSAFLEGGQRTLIGLWQVSIICPSGKGTGPGRAVALSLSNYFPVNLRLIEGSFAMQITSPVSLGPWLEDPESAKTARSTLPCSFQYRADIIS
jgi:hypothetical protein